MRKTVAAGVACLVLIALGGCAVTPYPAPPESPPATYDATEEQASEPPPPLPVYEQPPCPEDGYIWVPGVWLWGAEGYYWVPGTWVAPPAAGMLWTPGYWALAGGFYVFHPGYWGPHVGYYGGINYGHGYFGNGYAGGRWVGNRFEYNTAVSNVNVTNIHNTYNETVVNNVTVNDSQPRPSFVGARGVPPAARTEPVVAGTARMPPTPSQLQHHATARTTPYQNVASNVGRPPVAGTPRAGAFNDRGVTSAKLVGPAYHPPHAAPGPEKAGH